MIEFPVYRITDEHNNEILTEDPAIMQELVLQLLADNNEVVIRKEK